MLRNFLNILLSNNKNNNKNNDDDDDVDDNDNPSVICAILAKLIFLLCRKYH